MMHILADITNPVLPQSLGGGTGSHSISEGSTIIGTLITNIVGLLFIFGFALTFFELLMGGIQWLSNGGDKAQLESARNKITNAMIGLVILGASYAVFTLVGQFFGLDIKALKIPSFSGQ